MDEPQHPLSLPGWENKCLQFPNRLYPYVFNAEAILLIFEVDNVFFFCFDNEILSSNYMGFLMLYISPHTYLA